MQLKEVQALILSSDFRFARILSSDGVGKIAEFSGSSIKADPTAQELCGMLENFYESNPGVYTIICKKRHNVSNSNVYKYSYVTNAKVSMPVEGRKFEPVDESLIEKRIYDRIRKEDAEKAKLKNIQELQAEAKRKSDELDSAAGKFMHIATKILTTVLQNNPGLAGILQGAPAVNNIPMSQDSPIDLKSMSPEDQATANRAMTLLLSHMSPSLLLKFGEKIASQPTIVVTLKSFLNN